MSERPDAEVTWAELRDAHRRVAGAIDTDLEHRPRAAVLACSDARVPPSVVFGQPAGSLFVVRIAGNTASAVALASLDYAVEHLGVDTLIVLGHTECGAVAAAHACVAAHGCDAQGHLDPIIAPIAAIAQEYPGADPVEIVRLNVAKTVGTLVDHDGPLGRAARRGSLAIHGAVHDLRSGELVEIDPGTPITTVLQEAS